MQSGKEYNAKIKELNLETGELVISLEEKNIYTGKNISHNQDMTSFEIEFDVLPESWAPMPYFSEIQDGDENPFEEEEEYLSEEEDRKLRLAVFELFKRGNYGEKKITSKDVSFISEIDDVRTDRLIERFTKEYCERNKRYIPILNKYGEFYAVDSKSENRIKLIDSINYKKKISLEENKIYKKEKQLGLITEDKYKERTYANNNLIRMLDEILESL